MKKFLTAVSVAAFLTACGGKSNTNSGESGPSTTNVQNVNGNQPDTTNSMTLDTRQSADTTKRDSVPH